MTTSTSYARIADQYERVRGGEVRATELASAITPWLPSGVICDVGAGTGIVSEMLDSDHQRLIAADVSFDMIVQAAPRLPGRVLAADSGSLPLASGSIDGVTFVWVLHHVEDLTATLTETHRVLRPDGHLIAISGLSIPVGDDMAPIFEALSDTLAPDRVERALAIPHAATAAGFELVHQGHVRTTASVSPNGLANAIQQRLFSHLWDVPSATWTTVVEPAIDAMRSLPNPDQDRQRRFDHPHPGGETRLRSTTSEHVSTRRNSEPEWPHIHVRRPLLVLVAIRALRAWDW